MIAKVALVTSLVVGILVGLLAIWSVASEKHEMFSDQAVELGIDFVHFNGMTGHHYYPEVVGSGAALFDYDNDGDLDILIVQGSSLGPGGTLADALFPPRGPRPPKARLFRTDLADRPD